MKPCLKVNRLSKKLKAAKFEAVWMEIGDLGVTHEHARIIHTYAPLHNNVQFLMTHEQGVFEYDTEAEALDDLERIEAWQKLN